MPSPKHCLLSKLIIETRIKIDFLILITCFEVNQEERPDLWNMVIVMR